ncbi:MAG TPA: hypothetical protein VFI28_10170 [Candidatus Limnocylindrales bacterium]|nr:hypothetical protein [Candidatus Limnocylindrales bacterium]
MAIPRALARRTRSVARSGRAIRHSRALVTLAATVALALGGSGFGAPIGLGADATSARVVVTVVDDETREALPGAAVSLTAFVDSAAHPVFDATARTSDDGTVTFDGVPRAVGDAGVSVIASASLDESHTVDGCTIGHAWTGDSEPKQVTATTALVVDASREDRTSCDPPGTDAPALRGTVVGEDGLPFAVHDAGVSMHRADGGEWAGPLEVAADGSFAIHVEPWGTTDEPADLSVHVLGVVVASEADGDCTYDLAPDVEWSVEVQLAGGRQLEPIALAATLTRVSGVCSTSGTPAPTSPTRPAPSAAHHSPAVVPTLPPTDRLGRGDVAGGGGLAATLALLAVGGALALIAGRRRDRRDGR